jgi:predicted amidohydrolase YtcJ
MAARLTAYLVVGIVAATFIAGLIVGAQRDDYEGPVDLIVHNAQVYTANAADPTAEAVAIRGNQILRVGSNREINRLRRPQTTMIDAAGATVLPGFNDTNVRLVEGGRALLAEGREAAPVAESFEEAARDVPELASNPGRHRDSGRSQDARRSQADEADDDERLEAIRAAIDEAHRHGITSVHDLGATPADVALYDELRRAGDLSLRIYAALGVTGPFDEGLLTRLAELWKDFSDDPRFKTGAVTLDLDGDAAPDVSSAGMPGSQAEPAPAIDADELNRFVRLLDEQGWQIVLHADTARAVRLGINALAHADRSNPHRERRRRHRLDGGAGLEAADISRLERLGAVASVQPLAEPEAGTVRASRRTPPEVPSLPLASLDTAAATLAFGSGWPAAPLNPMGVLQAAVEPPGDGAVHSGRGSADERVTLESAIVAYTSAGAHASFDEQRKGTISPGMLADLVVLTDDIFSAPASRLTATEVAVTIFDGKVVYQRNTSSTR